MMLFQLIIVFIINILQFFSINIANITFEMRRYFKMKSKMIEIVETLITKITKGVVQAQLASFTHITFL
jgi:hypothetical protein